MYGILTWHENCDVTRYSLQHVSISLIYGHPKKIAHIVMAKEDHVLPLNAMSMLFTEHNTSVPITTSMELSSAGKASAT